MKHIDLETAFPKADASIGVIQLLLFLKDVDLETAFPRADASIGVIAVNVHMTLDVTTSIESTVIEDLNAVLAVLPESIHTLVNAGFSICNVDAIRKHRQSHR